MNANKMLNRLRVARQLKHDNVVEQIIDEMEDSAEWCEVLIRDATKEELGYIYTMSGMTSLVRDRIGGEYWNRVVKEPQA